MAERETTLPTELLQELSDELDGEYTLSQLDDAAIVYTSGPVLSAAAVGLASNEDKAVYLTAGVFAGSMMADLIRAGLIDPVRAHDYVDEINATDISTEVAPEEK
jgi:hypothetical protein